jgi:hypothetical protein
MKTYYSIVYTSIRPAIQEQVSVGLLLVNDKKVDFNFSSGKLNFLKNLMPADTVKFIKSYLSGIKDKINNCPNTDEPDNLFPNASGNLNCFSERYLSNIATYNNNLIVFSEPKSIDLDITDDNFKELFKKFISNDFDRENVEKRADRFSAVKGLLYPKIQSRVNVDVQIQSVNIPKMTIPRSILPERIHILGRNDNYISGQFIDFTRNEYHLRDELCRYISFVKDIDSGGKSFILGEKPEKASEKQLKFWHEIKDYNRVELVSINDTSIVEDYLIEHDVHPIYAI